MTDIQEKTCEEFYTKEMIIEILYALFGTNRNVTPYHWAMEL